MKKALILLLVSLFPALTLTGCRDLIEPEDMSVVSVVGFNSAPNSQIEMIIQDEVLTPSGMQTPKSNWNFEVHKAMGSTLYDAVQNNLKGNPQRVIFSHTKAIILSEELARQRGIRPVIDFLGRNPEIHQNTSILISKKGEFEKIFFPDATENADTGKQIQKIINNSVKDTYTFESKLKDFIENYWSKNKNPYALGVSTSRTLLGGKSINQGYDNVKADTCILDLKDIAVFKNDKMAGWLTDGRSRGFLYATGYLEGGTVNISYQGKPVTLRIEQVESNIKPVVEDDQVKMNISVKLGVDIGESFADIDIDEKSVIDHISRILDKQVTDEIKKAIDNTKLLSTDVFGFGDSVFKDYPSYWKQHVNRWTDSYSKLNVNVRVLSNVLHIGLTKNPSKNIK